MVSIIRMTEAVSPLNVHQHKERAPCRAVPRSSCSPPKNRSNCNASPMPLPPRNAWLFAPGSSCSAPTPLRPRTSTSPANWTVIPTPSASGGDASPGTALTASRISHAVADRPLFPPEDRHKVIVLATEAPADADVPVSHWSLTDLATKILNDAHYAAMSRATVGRILRECELKPHRCVQWLHSD